MFCFFVFGSGLLSMMDTLFELLGSTRSFLYRHAHGFSDQKEREVMKSLQSEAREGQAMGKLYIDYIIPIHIFTP